MIPISVSTSWHLTDPKTLQIQLHLVAEQKKKNSKSIPPYFVNPCVIPKSKTTYYSTTTTVHNATSKFIQLISRNLWKVYPVLLLVTDLYDIPWTRVERGRSSQIFYVNRFSASAERFFLSNPAASGLEVGSDSDGCSLDTQVSTAFTSCKEKTLTGLG